MRFRRLAIPAYGPFTDLNLEFPPGTADFHLIYGPNEAGKSSLLRAIRDLLYGIHAQTADNFRHDYKDLRISAELENRAGLTLAVQRRKGNRNTLLDAAGHALADDALTPFLGPVDRDFFTTMFGLGSSELRQGAHDLLQGRGDLGQALFSASLAGTSIHRVLDTLNDEARGLFHGRARVGVSLRPAVDAYEEALKASKQAQVKAETWEETLSEVDSASRAKVELEAGLHLRRTRLDWLQRCLDALPTLGHLGEVDASLAQLPPLPSLPAGFAEAAEAGRSQLAQAQQNLDDLGQRIAELTQRRDSLTPRADLLAAAAAIDTLAQGLAVYRQGQESLAAKQAEAARMQSQLHTGLQQLGLAAEPAEIAGLRITLAEELALRAAATALEQAEQACAEHQREAARLSDELDKVRARLASLPQGDTAALRDAHAATAAAAGLDLAAQTAALEQLARRLASQQSLLPGAPAEAAAVYALTLPAAARLREFDTAAADLAQRGRQLDEAAARTARQMRDLQAKLRRLEARGALPSSDDLARAREHREAGWQQVLNCWQQGTAAEWEGAPLTASYPAAVARADHLADRLREEAEAVAQAEELRWQIGEAAALTAEQQVESQRLEQARLAWQVEWAALWQAGGPSPTSPGEMLEWRERWLEFRNRYEAWRDLRDELAGNRARIAAAEALLRPLLDGQERPLAALRKLADQGLRSADQVLGERRALLERQAELHAALEARTRQGPARESALEQARTEWRQIRLGGANQPAAALRLLEARLALVTQYDEWMVLTGAIAAQRQTLASYQEEAGNLALRCGLAAAASTEIQVNALRQSLDETRALHARRQQVEEDLMPLQLRWPLAETALADARAVMADLLAESGVADSGVGDSGSLQTLLADLAARRRLTEERDKLRANLHVQARGDNLDSFIERVSQESGEALATEQADLTAAIRELEASREQAIHALARATDARIRLEASGADAALHLQTARHAAARIRQDAARYLRLRLATRFLHNQIETYRARNQGPMLERAGELFRRMTGDSFSGLGTDYAADDSATLVGVKAGIKVPVEGMSEGTRDQLYLALRLAAIQLHQLNHEPMPLILDDLLITFDDLRSRALLPMLQDLAGNAQVLLFTHHRHLLDLAREVLPSDSLTVHQLG